MDSICGLLLITTENKFHSILCLKKQQRACLQKYTNKGCQWEKSYSSGICITNIQLSHSLKSIATLEQFKWDIHKHDITQWTYKPYLLGIIKYNCWIELFWFSWNILWIM